MPELMREFRQFKHVQLVSDAEVDRGGCVVSHEHGRVDGTLATQLRRVVELLLPDAEEQPTASPVPAAEIAPSASPEQSEESATT
jgi:flagellar biosynthesis/type III secretory pathway protein FliH